MFLYNIYSIMNNILCFVFLTVLNNNCQIFVLNEKSEFGLIIYLFLIGNDYVSWVEVCSITLTFLQFLRLSSAYNGSAQTVRY